MGNDKTKTKKSPAQLRFEAELSRRVLVMRKSKNLTQEEVATALGVKVAAYQHYEATESTGKPSRSVMPHYLVPAFCKATGYPLTYFYGVNHDPKTSSSRLAPAS